MGGIGGVEVTVHAYVPSNGICRGFAFKYGKFLLPPRFLTALSVPKVPICEQPPAPVTVHTYADCNRILPMLRIPNRQNPLPPLYCTEFSVQKIPTCEHLGRSFLWHKQKLPFRTESAIVFLTASPPLGGSSYFYQF